MYEVTLIEEAEFDLTQLSKPIAQRILKKLHWLADNFNIVLPEPLKGQWQGLYKLRVGDYRVIYDFCEDEKIITVYVIKHRREVYKTK
ncbi:MAG: type II toxin-antitoxin system mRNA interferase toxin, RelE/StbE family [Candidatus Parabeggiatoa sp. nov. 1]|nr:MAG: type II toxin-antitoxin system mRNA interferase toxin, RelE/StbE family [Gammaproteobacteria bacterium]